MKILIASGIFPPDIGGPAVLAQKLGSIFTQKEIKVKVLCYSDFLIKENYNFPIIKIWRRHPRLIRYFIYFLKLLKTVPKSNIVYCLSSSPGMALCPLVLTKIFQKKFIIRPGGDFLWERATERNETELSLKEYYQKGEHKKKGFLHFLLNFIFKNADLIVFPTRYLQELYLNYYDIKKGKVEFIDYPFPEIEADSSKTILEPRQVLFAGRLIRFKNLPRLIEAFSKIEMEEVVLKIIGEGPQKESLKSRVKDLKLEAKVIFEKPLSHSELLKEIQKSYLVVIPSIFEPGSFLALECIKLKTPILFTKEAGLYEIFKNQLMLVDPLDVEDIKNKIEFLLNESNWRLYLQKICQINTKRSWKDVASEHIEIFKKI